MSWCESPAHAVLACSGARDASVDRATRCLATTVWPRAPLFRGALPGIRIAALDIASRPLLPAKAGIVFNGAADIDASLVNTGPLGHSYYGDNRSIISDIYYLLRSETPVGKRFGMFEQLNEQGLLYSAFRP